jgi:microcin C transport system substrate-binding protein
LRENRLLAQNQGTLKGVFMHRRIVRFVLISALGLAAGWGLLTTPVVEAGSKVSHGTSLNGDLKYPKDFTHFDYVNPDAPKGGTVRLAAVGGYDSLNPFILKGSSASGLGLMYDSLMTSSSDEPNTSYAHLAESIETPDDFSWVIYRLDSRAHWHDGTPVTVEDVIFSFDTIKSKGHPFYRQYFKNLEKAEKVGERGIKFSFTGDLNRELPHITSQLPIFSKDWYSNHDFEKTTLVPPMGSGPYRIKELDPGRSITYERVKDYWGKDLGVNRGQYNFDIIRYDYYRDNTVALEAFKSREFDFRQENTAKVWATGYKSKSLDKGWFLKKQVRNENPTGMAGLVFNTRRDLFSDPNVRRALIHAFDFEWTNKNLFYGQYSRTKSYFSNSEMASRELPGEDELKYLEPLRGKIPDEVFTEKYSLPINKKKGDLRKHLRIARKMLADAGWTIKDGKLTNASGKSFEMEILLVSPSFERIMQPIVKNLKRLGIKAGVRLVDTAQYQNRLNDFDFDTVVGGFAQSLSPGNEQRDFWGSANADIKGSRNLIGVSDPAIDSLINTIIAAPNRKELVAATRAMDRILLWGHYLIPHWHLQSYRLALWDRFGRPEKNPKYSVGFFTWWIDPDKAAALNKAMGRKE